MTDQDYLTTGLIALGLTILVNVLAFFAIPLLIKEIVLRFQGKI